MAVASTIGCAVSWMFGRLGNFVISDISEKCKKSENIKKPALEV